LWFPAGYIQVQQKYNISIVQLIWYTTNTWPQTYHCSLVKHVILYFILYVSFIQECLEPYTLTKQAVRECKATSAGHRNRPCRLNYYYYYYYMIYIAPISRIESEAELKGVVCPPPLH